MKDWIMSPQARRRLHETMRPEELADLAAEIARVIPLQYLVHSDIPTERVTPRDRILEVLTAP